MNRRTFLKSSAAALPALRSSYAWTEGTASSGAPTFQTQNTRWQAAYDRALAILQGNVRILPRYNHPVLIEGSDYAGIWMECGPHEALVYRKYRPDVARHSHMTFFTLQREDGQLPANNKLLETGFGQIQMVVPIAATAWELARATGDDQLLHTAYRSCSAWDNWLARYRNTRGTGLTEGFCTYDTGMDNSPRWAGIPPQCPHKDAKQCPPLPTLPRLCPDLSATTYGSRVALAAMARALGKSEEATMWSERAGHLRELILSRLYDEQAAAFYDLDAEDHFVTIDCDILSRICGEHVVDQKLFDRLWTEQIHNPQAFWAPCPLPSVALNDPLFVRPIPRNSWGGASQALTALRAGRWFDHYNRPAEFSVMMQAWCEALQRDMTFRQQLDPLTGDFTQTDNPGYSPACLVLLDYTWRLSGVCEEQDLLHWNARPGNPASHGSRFAMRSDSGIDLAMVYDQRGVELRFNGARLARIDAGTARLVTTTAGVPLALAGIHAEEQHGTLSLPGHAPRPFILRPNDRIALAQATP